MVEGLYTRLINLKFHLTLVTHEDHLMTDRNYTAALQQIILDINKAVIYKIFF